MYCTCTAYCLAHPKPFHISFDIWIIKVIKCFGGYSLRRNDAHAFETLLHRGCAHALWNANSTRTHLVLRQLHRARCSLGIDSVSASQAEFAMYLRLIEHALRCIGDRERQRERHNNKIFRSLLDSSWVSWAVRISLCAVCFHINIQYKKREYKYK